MTPISPEDLAAMFDLPPPPPAAAQGSREAEDALAAAEAALAAELAAELEAALESGGTAEDAPDSRAGRRVKVAWPARMQLPEGPVIELEVRNVSEGGVGLMSEEHIPACTVVDFEMEVPPLVEGGRITSVKGTIKTTYTVAHGSAILCGGTWQVPPAGLEVVHLWIKGLRG
jgi:hypothetical protein